MKPSKRAPKTARLSREKTARKNAKAQGKGQQKQLIDRRKFLRGGLGAAGFAILAGMKGHKAVKSVKPVQKKALFRVSIQDEIPLQTKTRLARMADISLKFAFEKRKRELAGKNVKVFIGTISAKEEGRLWEMQQAKTFAGIKTPDYYALTIIDAVRGKPELTKFNIHLGWEKALEGFKGKPDAVQRAILRCYGFLFNEMSNVANFEKYRPLIEAKGYTAEIRARKEIEGFENGISLLKQFIKQKIPLENTALRTAMLEELKFQQGLLESWKKLAERLK